MTIVSIKRNYGSMTLLYDTLAWCSKFEGGRESFRRGGGAVFLKRGAAPRYTALGETLTGKPAHGHVTINDILLVDCY